MEIIFIRFVTLIFLLAGTLLFAVALITMGLSIWDIATHWKNIEDLKTALLNAIGAIVISIAIIDVARYVFEQEVFKYKKNSRSAPVAATETLKKMFVIISIALSLEGLVYIFKAGAENISLLIYPSVVIFTSVAAMIGLGVYQWLVAKAEALLSSSPKN